MISIQPFRLSGFLREIIRIKEALLLFGLCFLIPSSLYAVPHSAEFDPIFWETRCECEEDWYCGFLLQVRSDTSSDAGCEWLSLNKYPGQERYPSAPLKFSNYKYQYFKMKTASQEAGSNRDSLFSERVRYSEEPDSQEERDEGSAHQPPEIETPSDEKADLSKGSQPTPTEKFWQLEEPKEGWRVQEKPDSDAAEQQTNHKPPRSVRLSSIEYPGNPSISKDKRETKAPFPKAYKSSSSQGPIPIKSHNSQGTSVPKKMIGKKLISLDDPFWVSSMQIEDSVSAILPKGTAFNPEDLKDGTSLEPLTTIRYKMESVKINIENGGLGDALWVVIAFSIEKMFLIFSKFTAVFRYLMNPFSFFGIALLSMAVLGLIQTHRE